MSGREVIMLGAGGHGKSVINVLRPAGYVVRAVLDDDPATWGRDLLGAPIVGPTARIAEEAAIAAVIAISDNRTRRRLAERHGSVEWCPVSHPGAWVYPTAEIGRGTVILPCSVIGAETRIGAHVIVSAQCTVGHDSVIGDYAQLAPGVHLAGGVTIGAGAFLGLGVVVNPGLTIGENTVVGAGGVVVHNLPADCTAIGIPARRR